MTVYVFSKVTDEMELETQVFSSFTRAKAVANQMLGEAVADLVHDCRDTDVTFLDEWLHNIVIHEDQNFYEIYDSKLETLYQVVEKEIEN